MTAQRGASALVRAGRSDPGPRVSRVRQRRAVALRLAEPPLHAEALHQWHRAVELELPDHAPLGTGEPWKGLRVRAPR